MVQFICIIYQWTIKQSVNDPDRSGNLLNSNSSIPQLTHRALRIFMAQNDGRQAKIDLFIMEFGIHNWYSAELGSCLHKFTLFSFDSVAVCDQNWHIHFSRCSFSVFWLEIKIISNSTEHWNGNRIYSIYWILFVWPNESRNQQPNWFIRKIRGLVCNVQRTAAHYSNAFSFLAK